MACHGTKSGRIPTGSLFSALTLRPSQTKDFQVTVSYSLIAFSVAFPLIYAILTTPRLYDEVRHFLFVVPPLCCLIGITLNRTLEAAFKKSIAGALVSITLGAYLLLHVFLDDQAPPLRVQLLQPYRWRNIWCYTEGLCNRVLGYFL